MALRSSTERVSGRSELATVLETDFDPESLKYEGEETEAFIGFHTSSWKLPLYWLLCIVTLGVWWLLCFWLPKLYLSSTCYKSSLEHANRICVKGKEGELAKVHEETSADLVAVGATKYFEWRYLVWRWYDNAKPLPNYAKYRPLLFPYMRPMSDVSNYLQNPVEDLSIRERIYSRNLIHVPVPNPFRLLIDEVLHPFYIFQLFSVVLWYVEAYGVYATAIIIISTVSAVTNIWQTRSNILNIKRLAEFVCPMIRLHDGFEKSRIPSDKLCPGDLVEVTKGTVFPCDLVLLSGQCVVNEAMLTGESVPVVKNSLPYDAGEIYNPNLSSHAKYTLFAGTRCVQAKPQETEVVVAMVTKTAFSTAKGALVRSILYPKPIKFKFYRDSFYFIGFLFLLTSLSYFPLMFLFSYFGVSWGEIVLRWLDLYTISIPPALPIALTIGVVFAVSRLKTEKISCIAPSRVNLAGLVNLFCFDKTGTLTEEGLSVKGVRECLESDSGIVEFIAENIAVHSCTTPIHKVLVACHGLSEVEGELVGDTLEVKMFEATQWRLEELETGNPLIGQGITTVVHDPTLAYDLSSSEAPIHRSGFGIIKRFDFESALQRMSAIVADLATREVYVLTKGAPEMIGQMALNDSLPPDYYPVMEGYTRNGFRVLACAVRSLGQIDFLEAKKIDRDEAEQGMVLSGLLIMQNSLKPETTPAIKKLKNADITNVMITGDNILTAVYVAKQCHIIKQDEGNFNTPIYLGEVVDNTVIWRNMDNDEEVYSSLFELQVAKEGQMSKSLSVDGESDLFFSVPIELAVTGPAFAKICRDEAVFDVVMKYAHVYARMKPDQKQLLVESLAEQDNTVGMCGDGANDCGALKAADVGVSLSEAEASIAAPFTSAISNVSCVVTMLREGRCALVTSFQAFKFMATYSLIQFTSTLLLYCIGGMLGDWQYLYIDLFLILPLAFGMSRTGAYKKLVKQKPTSSLISGIVLTSLLSQMAVNVAFQFFGFVLLSYQDWFVPMVYYIDVDDNNSYFAEVTVVFLIANFQYVASVFAFSVSKPFRKPFYTNYLYLLLLVAATAFNLYLVIIPGPRIQKWFQLVDLPMYFRWWIVLIAVINSVIVYLMEYLQVFLFVQKGIGPCAVKDASKAQL